jgi:hypothetical protein
VGAIFHMEPPRDQSLLDLHDHVGLVTSKLVGRWKVASSCIYPVSDEAG